MLVKKLICWSINKKARNLNKIGAIYGYYFDSQPTKLAARKLIILTTRNMSRRILLYTNHYLQKKKNDSNPTETMEKWERATIYLTVPSSAHA